MAYISKGRILFSLSKFLLICLSTCDIVKGKAPDGQLYVFSDRKGCMSVQSQTPCTVSWQLNNYMAKNYKQANEIVAAEMKKFRERKLDTNCLQALQKGFCAQVVPKCSTVDDTIDYGDTKTLYDDVYSSCPRSTVIVLNERGFRQPALGMGKQPNSPACVAPSTPVTGICPQPQFKMPPDLLEKYRKSSTTLVRIHDHLRSLKHNNSERFYSDECLSQLKDVIDCSALYCSANESQLLIKHDQNDCLPIINCFDNLLSKLPENSSYRSVANTYKSQFESICGTYPNSFAQLQANPPTVAALTSSGHIQHGHLVLLAVLAYFIIKTYV